MLIGCKGFFGGNTHSTHTTGHDFTPPGKREEVSRWTCDWARLGARDPLGPPSPAEAEEEDGERGREREREGERGREREREGERGRDREREGERGRERERVRERDGGMEGWREGGREKKKREGL